MDLKKLPADTLEEDDLKRAAGERYLQLAIESCLNIGNRIISLFPFDQPVNTPETSADIFVELHRLGFVDSDFSGRLIMNFKSVYPWLFMVAFYPRHVEQGGKKKDKVS